MESKCPICNGTGIEQLSDEMGEIGVAVECSCCKGTGRSCNVYRYTGKCLQDVCLMINDKPVPIISVA